MVDEQVTEAIPAPVDEQATPDQALEVLLVQATNTGKAEHLGLLGYLVDPGTNGITILYREQWIQWFRWSVR